MREISLSPIDDYWDINLFLRDVVAEIIKAGKVTCKATLTLPVYGVGGLIAQGHEILHTLCEQLYKLYKLYKLLSVEQSSLTLLIPVHTPTHWAFLEI